MQGLHTSKPSRILEPDRQQPELQQLAAVNQHGRHSAKPPGAPFYQWNRDQRSVERNDNPDDFLERAGL